MRMIKYKIVKERLVVAEFGAYTTYGIIISQKNLLIRRISEVTTDEKKLRSLCRLCNRLRLDPEHIDDVISDNLYV